jgi:glutamate racemase
LQDINTMKEHRIGFFDSGRGGFSILHEVMKKLPGIPVDYISDNAFAPYGEKDREAIVSRSLLMTDMLLERGCSIITVACNSATAAAVSRLREARKDTPFVGVEPYLNVLNHGNLYPGIRKAAVITTPLTGSSAKFLELRERLDPCGRIAHFSMPELATITEEIVECGLDPKLEQRLRREILPLSGLELSHLILGCTHYSLIASLLEKELGLITISPGPFVANRVASLLQVTSHGSPCCGFGFMETSSGHWGRMGWGELTRFMRFSAPAAGE